jgi:hypothetical protein
MPATFVASLSFHMERYFYHFGTTGLDFRSFLYHNMHVSFDKPQTKSQANNHLAQEGVKRKGVLKAFSREKLS